MTRVLAAGASCGRACSSALLPLVTTTPTCWRSSPATPTRARYLPFGSGSTTPTSDPIAPARPPGEQFRRCLFFSGMIACAGRTPSSLTRGCRAPRGRFDHQPRRSGTCGLRGGRDGGAGPRRASIMESSAPRSSWCGCFSARSLSAALRRRAAAPIALLAQPPWRMPSQTTTWVIGSHALWQALGIDGASG